MVIMTHLRPEKIQCVALCRFVYSNVCVGSITMMTMIIMALAVSGGLYLGTIAFSAYKIAELDKAISMFQKSNFINLA